MNKTEPPIEDVIAKVSTCNKCKCTVRVSILHLMTDETKMDFAMEVFEHNLSVSEMPIVEYQATSAIFCEYKP